MSAADRLAALQAAAAEAFRAELDSTWLAFQAATDAPEHKRNAFDRIAGPLLRRAHEAEAARPTAAPYVHGDPRVDRWQVSVGTGQTPPVSAAPAGFEPLAAWSFAGITDGWFTWERPLRACEVKPATTEEGALAALLTAWDAWPSGSGRHGEVIADITRAFQRAGLVFDSGVALTETARAIVARAAERGQP